MPPVQIEEKIGGPQHVRGVHQEAMKEFKNEDPSVSETLYESGPIVPVLEKHFVHSLNIDIERRMVVIASG